MVVQLAHLAVGVAAQVSHGLRAVQPTTATTPADLLSVSKVPARVRRAAARTLTMPRLSTGKGLYLARTTVSATSGNSVIHKASSAKRQKVATKEALQHSRQEHLLRALVDVPFLCAQAAEEAICEALHASWEEPHASALAEGLSPATVRNLAQLFSASKLNCLGLHQLFTAGNLTGPSH